jgi:hypothetical protein
MRSHTSIRAGLVLAMTLAAGTAADAQTNWPTARPRAAAVSSPVKSRKRAPVRRRKTATPRPVAAAAATRENELLRSMAELVMRQAQAIELLEKRLAAAESRLAALVPSEPDAPAVAAIEDAQAPFRTASLSIDWADVLSR